MTLLELREGAGRGLESVLNTPWEMHLTWGFLVIWTPWKPDLKDPGMESFNHVMVESLPMLFHILYKTRDHIL